MKYHLIIFWRTERPSFSVLKISWKICKCWGNIIFLPASCVEKDFFLLPEIHNINFSFSLNIKFHFVHSCLCNNLSFFRRNLFLLNILKWPTNLHCKGRCEIRLRNFFPLIFQGLQHDTCQCCSHQRSLEAGSVTWILQKQKQKHQYFNWKSYQPWSNTAYKKTLVGPFFFSSWESLRWIACNAASGSHWSRWSKMEVSVFTGYSLWWQSSLCLCPFRAKHQEAAD